MKNLKTFNEMRYSNIYTGVKLTPKQINYICDGIDKKYIKKFEILVDDGLFYIKLSYNEIWEFDRIQDLRDFIHLKYYMNMNTNESDKIIEIVKRNKKLDYRFSNNSPIRWSSYRGYTEIFKHLLQDKRVDPSDLDSESIIWASMKGHAEIVKILLQDDRVNPSADNNYAIKWASDNGHLEVVKLLIQHPKVRASLTKKEIEEYEKS